MDILNISKNGFLKRLDNSLFFESEDGKKIKIPILKVNIINIYSHVSFNSDLIWFLNQNKISLNLFNPFSYKKYGDFNYTNNRNNSKILYRQLKELYENRDDKIILLYNTLIDNMIFVLKYYQKNLTYGKEITIIMNRLRDFKKINNIKQTLNEYMLFEGKIWVEYYSSFDIILNKSKFKFEKRTKNPPENQLNSLISFINMKLYSLMKNIMETTQLDPKIGFLHELDGNRYSLVLDLSEIFKPLFVTKFIFNLINTQKIKLSHFNNLMLTPDGLFLVNKEWNDYMKQTIYINQLKKYVSYEYLIQLQYYKIIKYLFNINEEKLIFFNYNDYLVLE